MKFTTVFGLDLKAILLFFEDIAKRMLINNNEEVKQLIRRNKWVVQYSGIELQLYTRIYV